MENGFNVWLTRVDISAVWCAAAQEVEAFLTNVDDTQRNKCYKADNAKRNHKKPPVKKN